MEPIKPNDMIYTKFGYGVVVEFSAPQQETGELEELALYRGESKIVQEFEQEAIDDDQIVEVKFNWGAKGFLKVIDFLG
jgi:hypothetical protein